MVISIFDLFSIGIGPSSSHTVGPMKAAREFALSLNVKKLFIQTNKIKIELFGSLAFTGKGHGTDNAILLGLEGFIPSTIDPEIIPSRAEQILYNKSIGLLGEKFVQFNAETDLQLNYKDLLPNHTNGMRFSAFDDKNNTLLSEIYYSIGGGFITKEGQTTPSDDFTNKSIPYPFESTKDLIKHCEVNHITIKDVMLANEASLHGEAEVRARLLAIADVMKNCIKKGCITKGILPGGLNIKRRAPELYKKLQDKGMPTSYEFTDSMAWLNLYAIAVNEENAAGSRVVTAPTNGASGIIPAVLHYYLDFYPEANIEHAIDFLLTAGAIAILYKKNASISGAEVGCQGEVGTACSMAAAAITAMLGGTIYQIENAAEIAMEHHLGMTCDPINGLVQIPCIERNAMGAVKAVNAARLALLGDGSHFVSLDKVIATMKQTGKDMLAIYKETSLGGLAANIPEC